MEAIEEQVILWEKNVLLAETAREGNGIFYDKD